MSEVIVITSGKGGVGKTTTSANVGTGLAMLGKRVVLIDTDIGLRNLDVVMGLENRIIYNLVDVIEGNCRMKQALIRDKRYPDLFLLPSAQTRDKSSVSPGQMIKLVEDLREEFDYILLDCPAGIEQGFRNAIAGADRALIVTTPEVSAIRDADRIIGLLEASGVGRMDLIINRIRSDMVRRGDMMSVDDVMDILSVPVIGTVPDDEDANEYLENRYHLYSLMRLRASGPGYPASSNVHRRGRYDSDCRTVYEKEFRRDSQKAFKTPSDCRSGGLFAGTSGSDSRRFPEERVTLSGD